MNKAAELKSVLSKLSPKDRAFAESMLKNSAKYGGFTPKQEHWVDVLIARANAPEDKPMGAVGDFAGVYDLFKAAKAHQKLPKLNLQLQNGVPVVLSMAGERSKCPNTINVSDGGPFGSNKWYGRVHVDGAWEPGRDFPELGEVANLLKDLAQDPLGVAGKYGKLTGYCCFCHRPLSDEKSVAAGFGPVCAEHWGLGAQYKAAQSVLDKYVDKYKAGPMVKKIAVGKPVKPAAPAKEMALPALRVYLNQANHWQDLMKKPKYELAFLSMGQVCELEDRVEADLSPENLTCDGELSKSQVDAKYKNLMAVKADLAKLRSMMGGKEHA